MDKDIVIKTYYIFKKFEEIKAKIWNMGTDSFNTWTRFLKSLKSEFSYDNFNINEIKIYSTHSKEHNECERFSIKVNDKVINPRKDSVKDWSESALKQFLKVGSAFGVIIYNSRDELDNGKSFAVSPQMASMLNDDFDWAYFLLITIKNSIFSLADHIKNFGYSLFFCYVLQTIPNILNKLPSQIKFSLCKKNTDKDKFFYSSNLEKCKKHSQIIYTKTYKGLIDSLIKINDFDYIIDNLFNLIFTENEKDNLLENIITSSNDEFNYFSTSIKSKEDKNIVIDELSNERKKLRQCIIETRAKNEERYSDLILPEEPFLLYSEAAHIYDIKSINEELRRCLNSEKQSINENNKQKIIKQASNINNGLLMPNHIHTTYDRNIFQFDIVGNIIYQEENSEIIEVLKLEKCKIKENVLNEEMKDFLKKRLV